MRIWYDSDIDFNEVKKETIAVIGYGSQGRAQASNMKDSGLNIIVGLRKGGDSWKKAVEDGHKVYEIEECMKKASIIHILIPDMVQSDVYKAQIAPYLKKGDALSFSHGAAIQFKWITPPEWVDVIMIAPKSPGQMVRETYIQKFGTPALVAVQHDYSGKALTRILGMAKGVGCSRAGVLETTFKEEVETDLFGEQIDLCGGVDRLIRNAFDTLIEAGYQPEIAYFECLHELKLIVDLVQRYGIGGMYNRVSETARYGGLTRGNLSVNEKSKEGMRKALNDIQSGKFAEEWVNAYKKEGKNAFDKYMEELSQHQVEKVGLKLRKMMWPNQQVE
ncbi:MAG TPA: ketol-acid reductoisomerase [Nitrososphaerales archaeon]